MSTCRVPSSISLEESMRVTKPSMVSADTDVARIRNPRLIMMEVLTTRLIQRIIEVLSEPAISSETSLDRLCAVQLATVRKDVVYCFPRVGAPGEGTTDRVALPRRVGTLKFWFGIPIGAVPNPPRAEGRGRRLPVNFGLPLRKSSTMEMMSLTIEYAMSAMATSQTGLLIAPVAQDHR